MPRTRRAGFTLIELLIVVVIIGIIAMIAIPKIFGTREKAYVATMTSDLKNLVTAEEAYLADHQSYTVDQTLLAFQPTAGFTVTLTQNNGQGYNATASSALTTRTCTLYLGGGNGNPKNPEGVPVCP